MPIQWSLFQTLRALGGVFAAAALLAVVPWRDARADNGRDFAGDYRIDLRLAETIGTSRVSMTVRLRNVSGGAISNAVLELDSAPPAPRAQSFPTSFSLANHGLVTLTAVFTVPTTDALRWREAKAPGPALYVTRTNALGAVVRRNVELIPWVGVAR